MEVRQSVIGEIAIRQGISFEGVNLDALIRRLLLFDSVVVKSYRLREIPLCVKTFGRSGFLDLLDSGILKFSCEFTSLITEILVNGVRHLPPGHFSFGVTDVHDRNQILTRELGKLQSVPGLKNPDRLKIEETVLASLLRPEAGFGERVMTQVETDLRKNSLLLRSAIVHQIKKRVRRPVDAAAISIVVEEPQYRTFRVTANLEQLGISAGAAAEVLKESVSAVCNVNQRLADMEAYSAITGFSEEEAPLLFGKLAGILAPVNPSIAEEQFGRVVDLCGLPGILNMGKIDVPKLLKARNSTECLEFRNWLSTAESLTDAEITAMISGIRRHLSTFASSGIGKTMRFIATTAIGMIPGINVLAGVAAGGVDAFLVDKVLPRSGVAAFLMETYPSVFESP